MLKKLLGVFGLALVLAIIWVEGPATILNAASHANLALLIAAEAFLVSLNLFKGLRLHELLKSIQRLRFRDSLRVFCFGQLVNQGIMTALGEVSKGLMLKRLHGLSFSRSMSIIVVERGFDLLFALALSALVLAQVNKAWLPLAIGLAAALAALIAAIAFLPQNLFRFFQRFKQPWHAYTNFRNGLRGLSPRFLAIAFAVSVAAWTLEGLGNQFILYSLGVNLPLLTVLGVTSLSLVVGFASFIPGGIGAREASLVLLYSALGVPGPTALAQGLIYRISIAANDYAIYLLAGWRKK
ncbi:MAG: lysylphosphatidylglycerol synthase transmembrane domain-containing protein [Candidatus Micrarchaeia archaeon]|jgi:uncharacterized protein (TIRG00374 family)